MPKYTIATVDWNKEQTKVWEGFVRDKCPAADVVKIKDQRPFPDIPVAGILGVFDEPFKTDHVAYLDTDTIVFKDLEPLFEFMGSRYKIGITSQFAMFPDQGTFKQLYTPVLLFNDCRDRIPLLGKALRKTIKEMYSKELYLHKIDMYTEVAISHCLYDVFAEDEIWDFPSEIVTNIVPTNASGLLSNYKVFLPASWCHRSKVAMSQEIPPFPYILHYHDKRYLDAFGLGGLLCP